MAKHQKRGCDRIDVRIAQAMEKFRSAPEETRQTLFKVQGYAGTDLMNQRITGAHDNHGNGSYCERRLTWIGAPAGYLGEQEDIVE